MVGLEHEDVAFFLQKGDYDQTNTTEATASISFLEFVLSLYETSAAQDNAFLEKIFCPKKRRKILFPQVDAASDKIRVSFDIDSITFTGKLFPFKSQLSSSLPLKICLAPTQFRNLTKDTCIRMLDPVTDISRPLTYFKHTYILDIYGFSGYIFFPWLHTEERSGSFNNLMLNTDFHFFIENILLPCLKSLKPDGTFPDNVQAKNRFKGINKNNFNAIQFPVELFSEVLTQMRALISSKENIEMRCYRDFFLHFQSIGIKNIYKGDQKQTTEKLINFLENFVDLNCNVKAYYDIGVEFYYQDNENDKYSVFWSKEGAEALYNGLGRRGDVTRSGTMYSNDLLGMNAVS